MCLQKRKDIAVGISLSNSWYGCDYQLKAIALNQFMVWNYNIISNLEAIAYKTISQIHILNQEIIQLLYSSSLSSSVYHGYSR
jgi:hypothetical protein